jgi:hypothetical protein
MIRHISPFLLALLIITLPLLAHDAEPVDRFQFGMIRDGMREIDVLMHLGQPVRISEVAKSAVTVHTIRGTELREKRRYTYIYSGMSQGIDTYITFENGVVVHKARVPR